MAGTIMVAILIAAATTPVDIPTGMTTYGLDIVVKFDVACCRLWRKVAPTCRSLFEQGTTLHHRRRQLSIFFHFHSLKGHILTT
jgi:hypothetical protein